MKPTSKTPYEIRLELLQLAFQILLSQAQAEAGKKAAAGEWKGEMKIEPPTTEQVINEAEKMNSFISKANPSH